MAHMEYKAELSKVMDLQWPSCVDEAHAKLRGTFITLNKSRVQVLNVGAGGMEVNTILPNNTFRPVYLESAEIKSIELWLPDTGVYFTKKEKPVVLWKIPRRQWLKSFHPSNYRILYLEGDGEDEYFRILDKTKTEFWFNKQGQLMYYDQIVGFLAGNQLRCNSLLIQDVKDWMKNAKEKDVSVVPL